MIPGSPIFAVNKPKQSSERDGIASWRRALPFRSCLNCLAHLLSLIPYDKVPRPKVAVPPRATEHEYDDEASLRGRRFVPDRN